MSKRRMGVIFIYQRCSPKGPINRTSEPKRQQPTPSHAAPTPSSSAPLNDPRTNPPPKLGSQPRHVHMSRASMAATAALSPSTQLSGAGPRLSRRLPLWHRCLRGAQRAQAPRRPRPRRRRHDNNPLCAPDILEAQAPWHPAPHYPAAPTKAEKEAADVGDENEAPCRPVDALTQIFHC
ncbi:hypothetical protein B0T11DRAFT_336133, partial [Plectosphaerella cucumerina]